MKEIIKVIDGESINLVMSDFLLDNESGDQYFNVFVFDNVQKKEFPKLHIGFQKKFLDRNNNKDESYFYNLAEIDIHFFVNEHRDRLFNSEEYYIYHAEDGISNKIFHPFIVKEYIQKVKSNRSSNAAFTRLANK